MLLPAHRVTATKRPYRVFTVKGPDFGFVLKIGIFSGFLLKTGDQIPA
jgi:hypothetical protein